MPKYEVVERKEGVPVAKVEYAGIGATGWRRLDTDEAIKPNAVGGIVRSLRSDEAGAGRDDSGRFQSEDTDLSLDADDRDDEDDDVDLDLGDDFGDGPSVGDRWEYVDRTPEVATRRIESAEEWYRPEWGVPIEDYADELPRTVDALVEQTDEVSAGRSDHAFGWAIRYGVIADGETYLGHDDDELTYRVTFEQAGIEEERDMSKRRTGFVDHPVDLIIQGSSPVDMKFEQIVRDLRAIASSYDDVFVFQTVIEARNYTQ